MSRFLNMDNFLRQIQTALKVYIARGDTAIRLLEHSDWDAASKVLRDRKAAFCNYRTAETLTNINTAEFYKSQLAQDLWQHIELQEEKIGCLLRKRKSLFEKQLLKIKKEKSRISKYRSQSQNQNTFARSI